MVLNFDIYTANDGEEAVKFYQEYGRNVRVILMDVQMPVMDGYECTKQIREFEQANLIEASYIVGVSGEDTEEHRRICRQLQMNEWLTKPIGRDQFEQILNVFH